MGSVVGTVAAKVQSIFEKSKLLTKSIQPGQENVELSTSGMPAGMYIIRVSDGNKDVDNCRVIIR